MCVHSGQGYISAFSFSSKIGAKNAPEPVIEDNCYERNRAGARMAALQACGFGSSAGSVDTDLVDLRISNSFLLDQEQGRVYKFDAHDPLASWMRADVVFIFTPVLVCKYPMSAVGVPDAIASAALVYSQFYRFGETNTDANAQTESSERTEF